MEAYFIYVASGAALIFVGISCYYYGAYMQINIERGETEKLLLAKLNEICGKLEYFACVNPKCGRRNTVSDVAKKLREDIAKRMYHDILEPKRESLVNGSHSATDKNPLSE